jgi:hypothetical protein
VYRAARAEANRDAARLLVAEAARDQHARPVRDDLDAVLTGRFDRAVVLGARLEPQVAHARGDGVVDDRHRGRRRRDDRHGAWGSRRFGQPRVARQPLDLVELRVHGDHRQAVLRVAAQHLVAVLGAVRRRADDGERPDVEEALDLGRPLHDDFRE